MIKIYNRQTKSYDTELVSGEKSLKWLYGTNTGKSMVHMLVKRKLASNIVGSFCDTKASKKRIKKFVNNLNIDMSESIKAPDEFKSFNDFFTRKLKNTARSIDLNPNSLISPGDGRLLAYENINLNNIIQVKGLTYSLYELIGNKKVAEEFNGGTCLVLRLCPTDYHRFHFVDSGITTKTEKIKGHYFSVSPYALNKIPRLYCENKREWSILKSNNFDNILCIEVGATCVGSIVQTYTPQSKVNKGDEKGFFKFGGSTTILFLKKNVAKIDNDIIEQTKLGYETLVTMGEKIGTKVL